MSLRENLKYYLLIMVGTWVLSYINTWMPPTESWYPFFVGWFVWILGVTYYFQVRRNKG